MPHSGNAAMVGVSEAYQLANNSVYMHDITYTTNLGQDEDYWSDIGARSNLFVGPFYNYGQTAWFDASINAISVKWYLSATCAIGYHYTTGSHRIKSTSTGEWVNMSDTFNGVYVSNC